MKFIWKMIISKTFVHMLVSSMFDSLDCLSYIHLFSFDACDLVNISSKYFFFFHFNLFTL